MIKVCAVLVALGLMTGCSSSGTSAAQSSADAARHAAQLSEAMREDSAAAHPPKHRAHPTRTYPNAASAVAASCAAFNNRFSNDLDRLTPRNGQPILIRDAQAVLAPLIHTAAVLSGRSRKLYNDVVDLLEHVGSTSWPTQGTPLDRQITNVQEDCADG